jgi:hypothetical protein
MFSKPMNRIDINAMDFSIIKRFKRTPGSDELQRPSEMRAIKMRKHFSRFETNLQRRDS